LACCPDPQAGAYPSAARPPRSGQTGTVPDRAHRFLAARSDPSLAVLEGFHTLKHALRFGADILEALTPDRAQVLALATGLAPDLDLGGLLEEVTAVEFSRLTPRPLPTPLVALARRSAADLGAVMAAPGPEPVVLLDRPNHLGNIGAVIRVAAAAGAAAVLTTGDRDPWHPTALRGSAGLHFALPVTRVEALPASRRPLVAVVPEGAPLGEVSLPAGAVLALGSERAGLDPKLGAAANLCVGIPMRPGVSSLNLASAAAVVLYLRRPLSASR
jgi:TrmH family RNA methyltransferase